MDIKKKTKEWLKYISLFIAGGIIVTFITWGIYDWRTGRHIGPLSFSTNPENETEDCNIAKIPFHGELFTYVLNKKKDGEINSLLDIPKDHASSEDIVNEIEKANKNTTIKAILLEIDSAGGSPVGGEEIQSALRHSNKPTYVLIREAGTSAAYFAATGAKKIFASELSIVGDIGVTMSYVDNVNKNQQEGLTYHQLSTGVFKDAGSSDKPLTEAERKMFMTQIMLMHESILKTIAKNRNMNLDTLTKLADGSSLLGMAAKENKLIDAIGDIYTVQDVIGKDLAITPKICSN